ncbi:MAG TPA: helix-turn-helix domain-containing protein [Burkholderiaceae bacterium]|nr:helix-turn-helix domain-containing protein [Burkholderiaceae bacterium]
MDDTRPTSRSSFDHDGSAEPAASTAVRRFLVSQGVREHNHASEIARIIAVDRSQSYRRLKGDVAWSQDDLRAIARHFGSKEDLLVGSFESRAGAAPLEAVAAAVRVPRLPPHGQLVPGHELRCDESADLVAVRSPLGWEVYADGDQPAGARRHAVEGLTVRSPVHLQVALLEDDRPSAEAMVEAFRPLGLSASPFHDCASLLAALPRRRFDAFVLDWRLGESTATPVIESIRAQCAHVPIVVVTGALAEVETERQLYDLSAQWNFSTFDKPMRPMNLANALKQLVAVARG